MIKIDKYLVKIEIDLSNGIYKFDGNSSTGKTRLYKELKKLRSFGENVLAYSYFDEQFGIKLEELLKDNPNCQVLLIDRYDMMYGKYKKLLLDYSKNSIVIVDCKKSTTFTGHDGMCSINMTPDKITIWEM